VPGPGGAKKKGPTVAGRAWKFWERMPERPARYVPQCSISQVRKAQARLQNLQQLYNPLFYLSYARHFAEPQA
jgi:hypothetical protein